MLNVFVHEILTERVRLETLAAARTLINMSDVFKALVRSYDQGAPLVANEHALPRATIYNYSYHQLTII